MGGGEGCRARGIDQHRTEPGGSGEWRNGGDSTAHRQRRTPEGTGVVVGRRLPLRMVAVIMVKLGVGVGIVTVDGHGGPRESAHPRMAEGRHDSVPRVGQEAHQEGEARNPARQPESASTPDLPCPRTHHATAPAGTIGLTASAPYNIWRRRPPFDGPTPTSGEGSRRPSKPHPSLTPSPARPILIVQPKLELHPWPRHRP